MKRRTLDKIISIVSLGFAALLLLFAGLLNWGASFADENVASQLAMQNISFPAVESLPAATKDQLTKWADQKVITGEMARDYSDLYILEHMNASATAVTGKPATYSEVSGVYMGLVRGGSTDVGKIKQYWDEVVFLHDQHREYHGDYNGKFVIIPNLKENLNPSDKNNLSKVAGIVGTIEDRKQTHVSIQRALKDRCDKIYLFGHVGEQSYFENYVKPLIIPNKVILFGHTTNKQEMYDMIGRVYHTSKGEVACLVKDECYLTNTEFYGNEETENEVSKLTNDEVLNLWKNLFEL
jgi:hypothetical protein